MSASLSEPILLANYALPSSSGKKAQDDHLFDGFATVYASHTEIAETSEGQVTIAAQRDGIHILDLTDFHPVHSQTLGPSTTFACPPLTIASSSSSVPRTRRIIAAMHSGQGVSKQSEGKTLWQWTSPVNESTSAPSEKQSSSLEHGVAAILRAGDNAVCVSRECEVSVVGETMESRSSWKPTEKQRLLKPGTCVFLFSHDSAKKVQLDLLSVSQVGELSLVDSQECPIQNPERIVDISFDPSGHLSILENDGHWTYIQLEIRNGHLHLSASERIRLKSLLFTSPSSTANQKLAPHPYVSILALRSSFVLLAGVTSSPSRDIAILLWDMQYGVLLSSYLLPIPSTFEDLQPSSISISLIQGSSTQVLLSIAPFASPSHPLSNGNLNSSVLVLPYTAPSSSTILSALGKAPLGTRWLAESPEISKELKLAPTDDAVVEVIDESRAKVLEAMEEAMEENPKKAETIFMEWYKVEERKFEEEVERSVREQQQHAQQTGSDENRLQWPAPWKREVYMNDLFIRRLLEVALQPDNPKNKKHAAEVVRFLLDKRIVGHGLLEGGLVPALLRYSDWKSIFLTLKRVSDVPEDVLMRLLHVVVQEHRKRANDDSMAIDNSYPSIQKALAACVNYPASSVPTRTAIRKHFKDADEMFLLLEVLVGWLDYWCDEQVPLLQEKQDKKKRKERKDGSGLPRGSTETPELPSILFFLQAMLDSSFISLLQHPPSHALLRQILGLISPQIDFNETLEHLRGPLEPFATKVAADAIERENKEHGIVPEKKETKSETRRRVREQREMDELRIGVYQVEEVYL